MGNKLMRIEEEKKLGGVCAGIGHYFNIEVSKVRLIWVILTLFAGLSIWVYVVLWILMPSNRRY